MKQKLVVFSGAGMSAESGIQTFRDSDGLWANYRIEEIATPDAWNRNPDLVTEFYNMRRKRIIETSPNGAHDSIAELEDHFEVEIVTQNIDDLHERAGSSNVLHLHGNIRLAKSSGPNSELNYYPINGWKLTQEDKCSEGYRLRPHVVWFGEAVPAYDDAAEVIKKADILIVIGTSLQVYPAAGLIHYAPANCKKIIIDPKADQMGLPAEYRVINTGAVEGMKLLKEELLET